MIDKKNCLSAEVFSIINLYLKRSGLIQITHHRNNHIKLVFFFNY